MGDAFCVNIIVARAFIGSVGEIVTAVMRALIADYFKDLSCRDRATADTSWC